MKIQTVLTAKTVDTPAQALAAVKTVCQPVNPDKAGRRNCQPKYKINVVVVSRPPVSITAVAGPDTEKCEPIDCEK